MWKTWSIFFSVALRPQIPHGLLRTRTQDVHLDFHIAPELPEDMGQGNHIAVYQVMSFISEDWWNNKDIPSFYTLYVLLLLFFNGK